MILDHLCFQSSAGSLDPTKRKRLSPKWPTFSEFVQYLLDEFREGRDFDMHWAPIAEFCTPCHLHFEIIAKFETLEVSSNSLEPLNINIVKLLINRPLNKQPFAGGPELFDIQSTTSRVHTP